MGHSATRLVSGNKIVGGEEWRPLYDFPYYEISNLGRIRRTVIYTPGKNGNGYGYVNLSYNGRQRKIAIHRAVWETFQGPIPPDLMPNHKDGIKNNNDLGNLELVTNRENIDHYRDKLLTYRGESVNTAKLTADKVRKIRAKRTNGYSTAHLMRDYGVSKTAINRILSGKTWRHVV